MPILHVCFLVAMIAVIVASVCAVHWRPWETRPPVPTQDAQASGFPAYVPPTGSFATVELEVGQTFYLQTQTAKYVLTLRDPDIGLYDAVRVGPKMDGNIVEERFQMLFRGTVVPQQGLRYGEFIPGGCLRYQKIRGDAVLDVASPSSILRLDVAPSATVLRILVSVNDRFRQAS